MSEPKKNEVAKKGSTALAKYDYGDMAGQGLDSIGANEVIIPFLALLQGNSPQVTEKTVKGATASMFLNTATGQLWPADSAEDEEGIVFLPVAREVKWVEWIKREGGGTGGLVTMYDPGDPDLIEHQRDAEGRKIEFVGEDGKTHQINETYYVYGLILTPDGKDVVSQAVISFSVTKIKPYKKWMTGLTGLKKMGNPPMYAVRTRLRSFLDSNSSGQKYYNFLAEPFGEDWAAGLLDPNDEQERELLLTGKALAESINAGTARADHDKDATSAEDSDLPI